MKFIFYFLLLPIFVSAQDNKQEPIKSVIEAYSNREWDRCLSLLGPEIQGSHPSAESLLLLSKVYQSVGWYKKSVLTADRLVANNSSYLAEARWVKAQSLYLGSEYRQTLIELAKLAAQNGYLADRADTLLETIASFSLRMGELQDVLARIPPSPQLDRLRKIYLARTVESGRAAYAQDLLRTWTKDSPKSGALKGLGKWIESHGEGSVKIGLIVSLSGQNASIGKKIMEGVEFAVNEHNRKSDQKIEIVILDDHSDILQAIRATQSLVSDDAISLIIGPIESDHVAAAALVANESRIPLISPTATKSGLTTLGPYIFQANVNIEARCRALASYAMKQLGLRVFAILSPVDLYGDVASQAFINTVHQQGGRVIAFERYYDNTTDFKGQLTHLRKLGFISKVLKDWTYDASDRYRETQLDSVYAAYFPIDSLSADRELDRPMDGIDALFIPAYTEDIKYIGPQLAFYNIKSKLLGGQNWYDLTELRLHQNYINGVIFSSDFHIVATQPSQSDFVERFKKSYKEPPSREVYYGYDLMMMIASLIDEGYASSEELETALRRGIDFEGLHNRITFEAGSQANSSIQVLQFLNGRINKLAD